MIKLEVGQQFPLTIKRLGINGEGVGFFKKKVVFVPGALPGEEVVVEVKKAGPSFAEASIRKIRKPSKDRVKPVCPVYEECGGCQLQHLSYEGQMREKRDIVVQAFERYYKPGIEQLNIRKTIGMDEPWGYRNKSQFQVGLDKQKVIAGLYGEGSHRLINIEECPVQHSASNKVTQVVKSILGDLNIPIYNERSGKGLVRTIVSRVGFETGQVQVVLITAKKEIPRKELLVKEMQKQLPEVTSIVQNVNGAKTSLVFGDDTYPLAGEEVIQETLGDLSFELSARAFFQLNPIQTVKLYDEVKRAAGLTGVEKVVDAYCGVGTIGLWLATGAGEVRGMDVIAESIEDAKQNAVRHGFENAQYEVGKAEILMPKWLKSGWRPDVVVVDPPRSGLDEKLLKTLLEVKPKKIVYVSCNPSTLAKNVDMLRKAYKVEYLQPVDMFPHTSHCEVVAKLELK
ncbi:23S rRNA (uracil(1939)-C(5))-methyltransferase RlmD [Bacillus sp. HMF5848]|uniref:23S rRNA (uracil(1939)-C(5))-methyltransferase RlmD n=1 Tax=Bacillus sp. HMF5848 TaxID=2495421 RepID=UPI000F76DD26|nr:23S rRNA (uracil(1939)-C(5))-methyltransferase RlmD [Bacillus sp. HMF5848]RSK26076.1 23S rRNA (uracil(1939)-C(5))-methyltransferase RlmD [Bacillus sp. HMF5848]